MVCDQYGRQIRRALTAQGEVHFADSAPEGSQDGRVVSRPRFATHAQTIAALAAEGINWQAYRVTHVTPTNQARVRGGLSLAEAGKLQEKLMQEGNTSVVIAREIVSAGWPQLRYEELVKLAELPPTPAEELKKIMNAELRRDALRARREADSQMEKELQAAAE